MIRAVLLDRDDTIIDNTGVTAHTPHPGDLFDPELVRLLPGAGRACARLFNAGYSLIVHTNQAGIAEGVGTPEQIEATNDRMRELLAEFGVRLAGLYYSPFIRAGTVPRFTADHDWRKPAPGMARTALREFGVDAARSWAVGDAPRDIEAACAGGIPRDRCLRIGPGLALPDLAAAAEFILASDL